MDEIGHRPLSRGRRAFELVRELQKVVLLEPKRAVRHRKLVEDDERSPCVERVERPERVRGTPYEVAEALGVAAPCEERLDDSLDVPACKSRFGGVLRLGRLA